MTAAESKVSLPKSDIDSLYWAALAYYTAALYRLLGKWPNSRQLIAYMQLEIIGLRDQLEERDGNKDSEAGAQSI
jgi:hypothetical protein